METPTGPEYVPTLPSLMTDRAPGEGPTGVPRFGTGAADPAEPCTAWAEPPPALGSLRSPLPPAAGVAAKPGVARFPPPRSTADPGGLPDASALPAWPRVGSGCISIPPGRTALPAPPEVASPAS